VFVINNEDRGSDSLVFVINTGEAKTGTDSLVFVINTEDRGSDFMVCACDKHGRMERE